MARSKRRIVGIMRSECSLETKIWGSSRGHDREAIHKVNWSQEESKKTIEPQEYPEKRDLRMMCNYRGGQGWSGSLLF